jgi:hypothetical protein
MVDALIALKDAKKDVLTLQSVSLMYALILCAAAAQ